MLLFSIAAVIGLYNPNWVIRWGKPEGRTRIKAFLIYSIIAAVLYAGAAKADEAQLVAWDTEKQARQKNWQKQNLSEHVASQPEPPSQSIKPPSPVVPVEEKPKMEIVDGWTWKIANSQYTLITGKVKNVGDIDIGFFKVTAEYLDRNGNVVDTNNAADVATIRPGSQKEFKIYKENDANIVKVRLIIEEVKAK
jgi:hypothetical protein